MIFGCRSRGARREFSHPAFTGISRRHLHLLRTELRVVWLAGREGRLHARRGGHRRRAAGAGRRVTLRWYCLDSNANKYVYTNACNSGNNYQNWS